MLSDYITDQLLSEEELDLEKIDLVLKQISLGAKPLTRQSMRRIKGRNKEKNKRNTRGYCLVTTSTGSHYIKKSEARNKAGRKIRNNYKRQTLKAVRLKEKQEIKKVLDNPCLYMTEEELTS